MNGRFDRNLDFFSRNELGKFQGGKAVRAGILGHILLAIHARPVIGVLTRYGEFVAASTRTVKIAKRGNVCPVATTDSAVRRTTVVAR